jgi:fructokinase
MALILGIGEVLWDILPDGRHLGGAPANFAYHCHALGADAAMISAVGADPLGDEILRIINNLGLPGDHIAVVDGHPTGTVTVQLDAQGVPAFTIHTEVAWDYIPLRQASLSLVEQADAVCFGTLAQRAPVSRATIGVLLGATRPDAVRIFDLNLRQRFYNEEIIRAALAHATLLKLNSDELPVLAALLGLTGTLEEQLAALAQQFALRGIALTRGAGGSVLLLDGELVAHPGCRVAVRDTIGAGDAFTAALALGLLRGWPARRISDAANDVAAYVCTQPGATPPMPAPLRTRFAT